MSGRALYVYAIIPAPLAGGMIGGLTGIDGHPIHAVVSPAGVAALVHQGDAVPYLGSDDQVKQWILQHSQVVEHAWMQAGTVVPVTFNVLVREEGEASARQRLGAWLQDEAANMRSTLSRLRGRVELRVEIVLDRSAAASRSSELQALREEIAGKPAGIRRLLEKKAEQMERQAADRLADRLYPEYRRRIAALTEDLVEHRRPAPPPGSAPVLSVAGLVRRDAVGRLGTELARFREEEESARIRFLGPWPPYSFTSGAAPGSGQGSTAKHPSD